MKKLLALLLAIAIGPAQAQIVQSPPFGAGQIPGTTTNDNAAAGNVGELISSNVLVGSAVSVTNATATNVTSVSLTAGNWLCYGNVASNPAGATTTSFMNGWISTTSATQPTQPNTGAFSAIVVALAAGTAWTMPVGTINLKLASTTTVYLGTLMGFASSTMTAYGFLGCIRIR